MSRKDYLSASAMVLTAAFVVHATRIIFEWNLVINDLVVPMWASYVTVILTGLLAVNGFRLAQSRR